MAAACALIRDGDGRVLLIRENYGHRRYGFPAGAVDDGEAPHEAAIRETREETGVEVAVDRLVGIYEFPAKPLLVYCFACTIVAGAPTVPPGGEIAEIGWWAPDALPEPQTNVLGHALRDDEAGRAGVVRLGLPLRPPDL